MMLWQKSGLCAALRAATGKASRQAQRRAHKRDLGPVAKGPMLLSPRPPQRKHTVMRTNASTFALPPPDKGPLLTAEGRTTGIGAARGVIDIRLDRRGRIPRRTVRHLRAPSSRATAVVGPHARLRPIERLVVSSRLDPASMTREVVCQWFDHASPTTVLVLGSYYAVSTRPDWLTEGVEAELVQEVLDANARWRDRLRDWGVAPEAMTSDFRRGRPEDVLIDACREGDLLVLPAAGVRRLSIEALACPAVLVGADRPARRVRTIPVS